MKTEAQIKSEIAELEENIATANRMFKPARPNGSYRESLKVQIKSYRRDIALLEWVLKA